MTAVRALLGLAAVMLAAAAIYLFSEHARDAERSAARHALDARLAELEGRALAVGSPLACLNGAAGDAVETACERVIFGRPETTAAAVTFMGARIDLFTDVVAFNKRERNYELQLSGLRRAIETDRYGVAAHVLATRDGCTAERCALFASLRDTNIIQSNLRSSVFDQYVGRHAPRWEQQPGATAPAAETPLAAAPPLASGEPPRIPSANVDFPSAASIPPVSIMNAEPKLPAGSDSQASSPAPAAPSTPPSQPRRSQNPAPAR